MIDNREYLDTVKLYICTPNSYVGIYTEWFRAWQQLSLNLPTRWDMRMDSRMPLDVNRNNCVQHALDGGYTHLFFLDYDNVPEPDTVYRLWSYKLDVVGSLYFLRDVPHSPVAYLWHPDGQSMSALEEYPRGVVKMHVIGLGCSLWNLDLFKRIDPPWFSYEYNGLKYKSEDVALFRKLHTANIPVHVDTMHPVGHLSVQTIGEADWAKCKASFCRGVELGKIEKAKEASDVTAHEA